jgi:hypothetical protein
LGSKFSKKLDCPKDFAVPAMENASVESEVAACLDMCLAELEAEGEEEIAMLEKNKPEKCFCRELKATMIVSYGLKGSMCPPVCRWHCYRCAAAILLQAPFSVEIKFIKHYE